jgi:hypothetical protein
VLPPKTTKPGELPNIYLKEKKLLRPLLVLANQ